MEYVPSTAVTVPVLLPLINTVAPIRASLVSEEVTVPRTFCAKEVILKHKKILTTHNVVTTCFILYILFVLFLMRYNTANP